MKPALLCITPLLILGCASSSPKTTLAEPETPANEVILQTSDGVKVYGDIYRAPKPTKRVILMFHQAGSSAAEYAPIAPHFASNGYDCLAIDQRSGGSLFSPNRTITAGAKGDYLAAYKDLEAALDWAIANKYSSIVAWGSSYSASLVLKLASDHPQISGVIAFSPGEYFDDKSIVKGWNEKTKAPCFFAGTKTEIKQQIEPISKGAMRKDDAIVTNANAVHGSSSARKDRNPEGFQFFLDSVQQWLNDAVKSEPEELHA